MANDFISISGQDFYHYSIKSDKKKDLWRSLENLKVSHNTFGDGKIVEIDAYINISFSRNLLAETARTLVREAFKKGHIKSILIPKCHAFYEDLKNVKEERILREKKIEEDILKLEEDIPKAEDEVGMLKDKSERQPNLKNKRKRKKEIISEVESIEKLRDELSEPAGSSSLVFLISFFFILTDGEPIIWMGVGYNSCLFWLIVPLIIGFFADIARSLVSNPWTKYEEYRAELDNELEELGSELTPIDREIRKSNALKRGLKNSKTRLQELRGKRNSGTSSLNVNRAKSIKIERKITRKEKELVEKKNRITSLEEEIQAHWDSIAHLIPFSTALEKA